MKKRKTYTARPNVGNRQLAVNADHPRDLTRNVRGMFGGAYNTTTKHDHYSDFGWPEQVSFQQTYRMYCRNSIASAVVDKTISKVWETDPAIWESAEPTHSKIELEIADRFNDLRVWQSLAEADTRAMVGRYAAVILRLADGKAFDQPVDTVPGGVTGLVGVIPCWESQLLPVMWDTSPASSNYGSVTMYQFNESSITDVVNTAPRSFGVHPDRVLIWSQNGTVVCRSELESIYNDLIDAEKIKGAGGEGFWKVSRASPVINSKEGMDIQGLAQALGVPVSGIREALNEQMDDYQAGFDKALVLGGLEAKTLGITLTSPEHFFAGPIQSIAAARGIPVPILMGNQTGERASTENAREFALTCNSRRVKRCRPLITEFINRLERFKILPEKDWVIGWSDLTASSEEAKLERAAKMMDINKNTPAAMLHPFTPEEIRDAAGFQAELLDGSDNDDDEDS